MNKIGDGIAMAGIALAIAWGASSFFDMLGKIGDVTPPAKLNPSVMQCPEGYKPNYLQTESQIRFNCEEIE